MASYHNIVHRWSHLLLLCVALGYGAQHAYAVNQGPEGTADSLVHKTPTAEVQGMHTRMVSSSLPVQIRQQGRQLCVQTRYNQLLPVYRADGSFYSAFRLSKGTNWLNGLPKGTYIINNRRFTIY